MLARIEKVWNAVLNYFIPVPEKFTKEMPAKSVVKKPRWSEQDIRRVHYAATVEDYTIQQLAEDCGRTEAAIRSKAISLGYSTRNGFIHTIEVMD